MNKKMVQKQLSCNTKCFDKYFQKMGCIDATEHQKRTLINGLVFCAMAGNKMDIMLKNYYEPRI